MVEHGFGADALNKFSQLTPWVQAIVIVSASSAWLGMWYFLKEALIGGSSRSKNTPPIDE